MKPYSQDLRERVLAAVKERKASQAQIARTFKIGQSTLEKWLRRQRETGSCAARPHGGGNPRALAGCESFLRAQVKKQPDVSLDELRARVAATKGVQASPSMMCRELSRLNLRRKKSRFMTVSAKRHG
jgi:transposase